MLPGLSLHLVEVQRKDKELGSSLAAYIAFIHQAYELRECMPKRIRGVGKAGPPFQTIQRNLKFLTEHFPELPKDLAEVIDPLFRMPAI
jgi:hypothetical protein